MCCLSMRDVHTPKFKVFENEILRENLNLTNFK
jgi:hypothetical protein